MIVSWLVYCLLVSALVSAAAWLGERASRAQGWPGRWAWAVALAGSVAFPAWAWLAPSPEPVIGSALPGAYVMEVLPPIVLEPGSAAGPSLGDLLLLGWGAASGLLLLWLVVAAVRLRASQRGWGAEELDGVRVLVSERTGPAALGLIRGRVVLPRWALEVDGRLRRLMVLHEAEHVRAGDPQLAVSGLVLCVLMPWNLPLWWQLHRLRLAIEMDCDARVLRRTGDVRSYGALLLEVGQRRSRLALGLVETRSSLERRIRMMTDTTTGRRTLRALGLAAVAGVVLAVACETPGPTEVATTPDQRPVTADDLDQLNAVGACEPGPVIYLNAVRGASLEDARAEPERIERIHVFKGPAAAREGGVGAECGVIVILTKDATAEERAAVERLLQTLTPAPAEKTLQELSQEPTFTPMTRRPMLRNQEEVQQLLQEAYPPLLKDAGIEGTANVWFFIDAEGTVQKVQVNASSGHDALDQAALKVAGGMSFTPAYNRDQPVPVWVALDITFSLRDTAAPEPRPRARQELTPEQERERREIAERMAGEQGVAPTQRSSPDELAAAPTFTPMTVRPQLKNHAAVQEALRDEYPPLLRNAGIEGTTSVWFFIADDGRVEKVQVNESSGYSALDEAALRVARRMAFSPAYNRDRPVSVWVALDISFRQDG